ncbi:thiamine diphosphate-binding protein, partial [Thamnocephalis sphaerospora]
PLLLLAGSSHRDQVGMGAFQELNQVEVCRPFTKYAAQPFNIPQIPHIIERAYHHTLQGRPGAAYVDLPADFINGQCDPASVDFASCRAALPLEVSADEHHIKLAASLLCAAKKPLIVIGKGAAYARAESEVRELVNLTGIPFLPTPMGKGVVPDDDMRCASAARSLVLKESDVILVLGARLNWILHFGLPPRFRADVKIIHVDVCAEELGRTRHIDVPVVGHLRPVLRNLIAMLRTLPALPTPSSEYTDQLRAKVQANELAAAKRLDDGKLPLSYHHTFKVIRSLLPSNVLLVSEGAKTMDISRSIFTMQEPRTRLDAATSGAMGPALGYAIAAQLLHPDRRVAAVLGDSAFGFSAMELETAARHKLPLIVVVINNNGIYAGLKADTFASLETPLALPPSTLLPNARYEMMAEAFGGRGFLCRTGPEVEAAVRDALAFQGGISVINILIDTGDPTQELVSGPPLLFAPCAKYSHLLPVGIWLDEQGPKRDSLVVLLCYLLSTLAHSTQ